MTQMEMGLEVESEHKSTYEWLKKQVEETGKLPSAKEMYKHIAQDHLDELNDYYTRLMKANL